VGNAGSRCGEPGRPGRADVAPPRPFSSIAAMYPVLASATAPAISGALSTRPQRRRRSLAGFKEVSYYHRVTPCGLSNRARRTPRSWAGVASRDGRQRWGSVHSGDEGTAGFRESGLCSHRCGPWACGSGSPTRSAALAWTLNKYTPAKECRPARGNRGLPGWGSSPHQP